MADFSTDLDSALNFLRKLRDRYSDYKVILEPDYESGDIELLGIPLEVEVNG